MDLIGGRNDESCVSLQEDHFPNEPGLEKALRTGPGPASVQLAVVPVTIIR